MTQWQRAVKLFLELKNFSIWVCLNPTLLVMALSQKFIALSWPNITFCKLFSKHENVLKGAEEKQYWKSYVSLYVSKKVLMMKGKELLTGFILHFGDLMVGMCNYYFCLMYLWILALNSFHGKLDCQTEKKEAGEKRMAAVVLSDTSE